MPLTKTTIEFADFTANPVRGKCLHNCDYCYVERSRTRFKLPTEITWHPDVLADIEKRKQPATIFLGSTHDLFGNWIKSDHLRAIGHTIKRCPQHTFILLTKTPARYFGLPVWFDELENCWCGASVDTVDRVATQRLAYQMVDWLSCEPLLEDILEVIKFDNLFGITIGAQSGKNAVVPKKEWVEKLINKAVKNDVKVFVKDNLLEIYPEFQPFRELPWDLFTKSAEVV